MNYKLAVTVIILLFALSLAFPPILREFTGIYIEGENMVYILGEWRNDSSSSNSPYYRLQFQVENNELLLKGLLMPSNSPNPRIYDIIGGYILSGEEHNEPSGMVKIDKLVWHVLRNGDHIQWKYLFLEWLGALLVALLIGFTGRKNSTTFWKGLLIAIPLFTLSIFYVPVSKSQIVPAGSSGFDLQTGRIINKNKIRLEFEFESLWEALKLKYLWDSSLHYLLLEWATIVVIAALISLTSKKTPQTEEIVQK